jgi:hypothetical protein
MTITRAALLACVMATVCMTAAVLAQQTPAAAPAGTVDAAATLRTKDVLSEQDKAQLRQWIVDHVASLGDAAGKNDLKTMAQTKRNMVDAAANSGSAPATAAFRNAYAELCAAIFQPYLGIDEQSKGDTRVALCLAQLLGSLKHLSCVDTMLVALGSKYPAVRLCAARNIRDMRADIAATRANQLPKVITTLQQAGAKEGDAPTARMLYEAVDFRAQAPAMAGQVLAAMVEMLKGRQQFYANELMIEFYPDASVMNLLASVDLPDAEKRKAIPIVHAIVDAAAQRWTVVARAEDDATIEAENPYDPTSVRDWHLRYQLAFVTQEGEALLRKLGAVPANAQAPDIASLMMTVSTAEKVRLAADKWQDFILPKAPATAAAPATP